MTRHVVTRLISKQLGGKNDKTTSRRQANKYQAKMTNKKGKIYFVITIENIYLF